MGKNHLISKYSQLPSVQWFIKKEPILQIKLQITLVEMTLWNNNGIISLLSKDVEHLSSQD